MKERFVTLLSKSKKSIYVSLWVFLFGVVSGAILVFEQPEVVQKLLAELIPSLVGNIDTSSPSSIAYFIIKNNITLLFVTILLGIIFAFIPLFVAFANGVVIGIIGALFASQGFLLPFIVGIVPHGIIELPIAVMSFGLSLYLGVTAFSRVFRRGTKKVAPEITSVFLLYVLVFIPFLILAGIIEAYITPYFISFMSLEGLTL